MEDVELRYRISHSGAKTLFLPDASVCHPWRTSSNWAAFKRLQKSVLIYLDIHPDERAKLSSRFYLHSSLNLLRKSTLPGIFKFRGAGLTYELLFHFFFWQTAWILFFQNRNAPLKSPQNVKSSGNAA
jgi:GT2 family glycosyltransferase